MAFLKNPDAGLGVTSLIMGEDEDRFREKHGHGPYETPPWQYVVLAACAVALVGIFAVAVLSENPQTP